MIVTGINHKTASMEVREKLFLSPMQQDLVLTYLKSNPQVLEAFILSTCNRTEIYLNLLDASVDPYFVFEYIAQIKKLKLTKDLRSHLYRFDGVAAVEHLFKVVCGLDSLVLGEKQILGQVKHAVERARLIGMFSKQFNVLFNVAVRAGKKVQTETRISHGGSSVSWAAVVMTEQVLGTLESKSVLIIGAGKMGTLAINQICQKKLGNLYLMNRTGEKAEALAKQHKATAVSFMDIKEILSTVDVCICSAGAPHYILDKEVIEKIILSRQSQPLVLVDISMPRNIDPTVAELSGVRLIQIDDLDQVVSENMKIRQDAVQEVERIIQAKVKEFFQKLAKMMHDTSYVEQVNVSD